MEKSHINNSQIKLILLMHKQYLMKNRLIVLNILLGINSVSLFSILFGMHYLVALNIFFEMNSLRNSRDLNH